MLEIRCQVWKKYVVKFRLQFIKQLLEEVFITWYLNKKALFVSIHEQVSEF